MNLKLGSSVQIKEGLWKLDLHNLHPDFKNAFSFANITIEMSQQVGIVIRLEKDYCVLFINNEFINCPYEAILTVSITGTMY